MMTIENDRQLKTAMDFLTFIKSHNTGMTKDKMIDDLIEENEALKREVKELEMELRVSRDLLTIARCVK